MFPSPSLDSAHPSDQALYLGLEKIGGLDLEAFLPSNLDIDVDRDDQSCDLITIVELWPDSMHCAIHHLEVRQVEISILQVLDDLSNDGFAIRPWCRDALCVNHNRPDQTAS